MQGYSNFNLQTILGKSIDEVDNVLLYKESHINRIEIPKRDGSLRHILAPSPELKFIQKSIYWRFFKRYKANEAAHGFVAKRGICTNADSHVGANCIGKIDIKNFFDSISEEHLKNCIFGNKHICRYCKNYERMMDGRCHPSLYYNKIKDFEFKCEEIKAVYIPEYCQKTGYQSLFNRIIDSCTYTGCTAQGFPTSPVIANIVMRGFDITMSKYCKENNIQYTRYADDLTFSSKEIDKEILQKKIQKKAYNLLRAYKFTANYKKTKWKSNKSRMKVCGIVVNVKKSLQKSEVKLFRAKVHHATIKHADKTTRKHLRELKGWASYLMSVDHNKGKKYMTQLLDFEKLKFSGPVSVTI